MYFFGSSSNGGNVGEVRPLAQRVPKQCKWCALIVMVKNAFCVISKVMWLDQRCINTILHGCTKDIHSICSIFKRVYLYSYGLRYCDILCLLSPHVSQHLVRSLTYVRSLAIISAAASVVPEQLGWWAHCTTIKPVFYYSTRRAEAPFFPYFRAQGTLATPLTYELLHTHREGPESHSKTLILLAT